MGGVTFKEKMALPLYLYTVVAIVFDIFEGVPWRCWLWAESAGSWVGWSQDLAHAVGLLQTAEGRKLTVNGGLLSVGGCAKPIFASTGSRLVCDIGDQSIGRTSLPPLSSQNATLL